MRTTIEIPDDLHQQALSIAKDTSRTLEETIAELMRRGLGQDGGEVGVTRSARTGLPVVRLGTVITSEDVRALEDED
jgi:Arc/MetJ family transcription regulator